MGVQLFKNNATAKLASPLTTGATIIYLEAGKGSLYPNPTAGDYFLVTLYEKDISGVEFNFEIVKCTARVADTLTVVRDFEGIVVANGGTSGGWPYPTSGTNPTGFIYLSLRHTAYAAENHLAKDGNLAGIASVTTARTNIGFSAGVAEVTTAATSKTTPVDADEIPMSDSAASFGLKKLTWANLKATLATWLGGGTIAGSFTTLTSSGNATLGDAEATDTHAVKGVTTVLASSANPALKVTQTGAGNAFVVEDSASTDSTPFVIDGAGRVLIGNPTSIAGGFAVQANYQLSALTGIAQNFAYGASSSGPGVWFHKSRNATVGSHTVVNNGDDIGGMFAFGSDGTNFEEAARIVAQVDGAADNNDMPGRLVFSTTPAGAISPVERMRIDSAGNVVIGAGGTIPEATLYISRQIAGSTNAYAVRLVGMGMSEVTSNIIGVSTALSTTPAAYTVVNISHHRADQAGIGAGSIVSNQHCFIAPGGITGATNNYSFLGAMQAPTAGTQTGATITSMSSSGTTTTITAANSYTNGQTVTIAATANASALTNGCPVTILTLGTTTPAQWIAIGAVSGTAVGESFTATGPGTGTGTVTLNQQGSGKTVASASGTNFTVTSASATYAAVTLLTGTVTVSTRYNFYASGTADNAFLGNVGVGTVTPKARFESLNTAITGGGPATSGSAVDPNAMARLGGATVCMDFGLYASGVQWIQTRVAANYATNLDLILNPNGGAVLHGVGGMGYAAGIGAGGTVGQFVFNGSVSQAKNQGVTLSKPTGQITMGSAALAPGVSVTFIVTNTLVTTKDTVSANIVGGVADANAYRLEVMACVANLFYLRLTNISAGSLSESVLIQFNVNKGATS